MKMLNAVGRKYHINIEKVKPFSYTAELVNGKLKFALLGCSVVSVTLK